MTAIKVAEVSADMLLKMDKASVERTKRTVKEAAKSFKESLGEIGEKAKESLKDLTEAGGSLGGILSGAFSGLSESGPIGLIIGALAAAIGSVGIQAEHMSKQFENSVTLITQLKAKAEGLGLTFQQYQRLQYLSNISGTNVETVERVITRLNLHAGEIQTTGAGTNDATRFLSQVWGGDGSNLSSDKKLNAFMKGLQYLIKQGRRGEAVKILNDVAPIAARDPAAQGFLLGKGLQNWNKANEFEGTTSQKDINTLSDPRNLETYYGNMIEKQTRELHRVADNMDAFRKNYENVEEMKEALKDKLADTASVEKTATGVIVDVGKAIKYASDQMAGAIQLLKNPDYWSGLVHAIENGLTHPRKNNSLEYHIWELHNHIPNIK